MKYGQDLMKCCQNDLKTPNENSQKRKRMKGINKNCF